MLIGKIPGISQDQNDIKHLCTVLVRAYLPTTHFSFTNYSKKWLQKSQVIQRQISEEPRSINVGWRICRRNITIILKLTRRYIFLMNKCRVFTQQTAVAGSVLAACDRVNCVVEEYSDVGLVGACLRAFEIGCRGVDRLRVR